MRSVVGACAGGDVAQAFGWTSPTADGCSPRPTPTRRRGSSPRRPTGCGGWPRRGRAGARGARGVRRRRHRPAVPRPRVDRGRARLAPATEAAARPRAWRGCTRPRRRASGARTGAPPAAGVCRTSPRRPGPTFYGTQRLLPAGPAGPGGGRAARPTPSPASSGSPTPRAWRGSAAPTSRPARLHGDLWAGNRLVDEQGESWLDRPRRPRRPPRVRPGHDAPLRRVRRRRASPPTRRSTRSADGWEDRVAAAPDRAPRGPRHQVRRRLRRRRRRRHRPLRLTPDRLSATVGHAPAPGRSPCPTTAGGQGGERERCGRRARSRRQRCSTIGMPAPSRAVWIGRSPVRVSSMFTESMPTTRGPGRRRAARRRPPRGTGGRPRRSAPCPSGRPSRCGTAPPGRPGRARPAGPAPPRRPRWRRCTTPGHAERPEPGRGPARSCPSGKRWNGVSR